MSESSDESVLDRMFVEYHDKNMINEDQDSSSVHIMNKDNARKRMIMSIVPVMNIEKEEVVFWVMYLRVFGEMIRKRRQRDSSKELPAISLRDSVCTIENVVTKMRQEIVDCELNYPENKQCAELLDETLKHIKSSLHLAAKLLKLSPSCSELENHKKARGKQEEVLYEYFSKTIRPTQPLIEHIAKKLEVDKARVNRWFIN